VTAATAHRALAAAVAAALLIAAPAAYAFWSNGAGTGAATAATPQAVTIAPGTATQALYPTGQPMGDVAVAVTNPNAYGVHLARLVLDTAAGSGGFSAGAAGCGLMFVPATAGWDVPAGATVPLDLRDSLAMATSAPASCQGLSVHVYLKAAP
jgi:hypothetical protein